MGRGENLLRWNGRCHHVPVEALKAYFSRAWWSLTLSGILLLLTVLFAAWWIVEGANAPAQVEPLTIVCGTGVALLELIRPGQKHEPEDLGPPSYVLLARTFGRAIPRATSEDVKAPAAKVLGAARGRPLAFRQESIVQVGGSALDAMAGPQVEALNRATALAQCLHTTGEHGVTKHHRRGGELIFRIVPSYTGIGDEQGRFDMAALKDLVASNPTRALEIDMRRRRPPGAAEHSRTARRCPDTRAEGGAVNAPRHQRHAEFSDTDSLLDWTELLASETGLPVGIRPTVGDMTFWDELTQLMALTGRGVDFVAVDTGPVPEAPRFHAVITLPFLTAFSWVYSTFARADLTDGVVFIGSGDVDNLYTAVAAFALGCDVIELSSGLLPALGFSAHPKPPWTRRPEQEEVGAAVAQRIKEMRADLIDMAETAGVEHPALLDVGSVMEVATRAPLVEMYGYRYGWGLPSPADRQEIVRLMSPTPYN